MNAFLYMSNIKLYFLLTYFIYYYVQYLLHRCIHYLFVLPIYTYIQYFTYIYSIYDYIHTLFCCHEDNFFLSKDFLFPKSLIGNRFIFYLTYKILFLSEITLHFVFSSSVYIYTYTYVLYYCKQYESLKTISFRIFILQFSSFFILKIHYILIYIFIYIVNVILFL